MNLYKAVEILKAEQYVAECSLNSGEENTQKREFIESLNVVFSFIYDVLQISKIGK